MFSSLCEFYISKIECLLSIFGWFIFDNLVIININVDISLYIIVESIIIKNIEIIDWLSDEVAYFGRGFIFIIEIFEMFIVLLWYFIFEILFKYWYLWFVWVVNGRTARSTWWMGLVWGQVPRSYASRLPVLFSCTKGG